VTEQPSRNADEGDPEDGADLDGESDDDLGDDEDFDDEFEDDLDEPAPEEEPERRWPLGVMLSTVIGVWVGRAFYRLPDGLENLAGLGLSLATAVIAVGIYRRWVRRQFATARARRVR
jgi:hypothetical protein